MLLSVPLYKNNFKILVKHCKASKLLYFFIQILTHCDDDRGVSMKSTLENCIPGLNIKVPGELDFYENVFLKKFYPLTTRPLLLLHFHENFGVFTRKKNLFHREDRNTTPFIHGI